MKKMPVDKARNTNMKFSEGRGLWKNSENLSTFTSDSNRKNLTLSR